MDVVIDTDVLSVFVKIRKVELLQRLFTKRSLLLTPHVYKELKYGERLGFIKLSIPTRFAKIKLQHAEKRLVKEIHGKRNLSLADSECVAVSHNRKSLLVTNDDGVKAEADRLFVQYVDLIALLRMLWKGNIMSKEQVRDLIDEIEKKDRIVIGNKDVIFR